MPPFDQFLTFFGLVCFILNPHAKFEIYNFSHYKDIKGSQNLKSRSRDQGHAPFGQFFIFFGLLSLMDGQLACKI